MRESDGIEIAGAKVRVLVSSRETAGRYTMCEIENAGPAAAPAHSHLYEDVCFFVLEGHFCFELSEGTVAAPRGTTLFVPRGVSYRVNSEGRGRLLLLAFPGGADLLFHDLAVALDGHSGAVAAVFEKHGIQALS